MSDTKEKDGGPAYPSTYDLAPNYGTGQFFGMSLRDYFAAKAMAGCLAAWYAMDGNQQSAQRKVWYSEYDEELSVNDCISADAYALADAMLKAREQ
jgi:hypothetical protein